MSPNRSLNLRSLRLFSETIFYTQAQSLNLRFHKEASLCTHKLRDPALGPECPKDPYINFIHKPPQTSPQTASQICDLYQTLFRDLVCTQVQSLDLRDPQRGISVHTQTQRPVSGVQSVLRILTATPSTSIHKLMSPNRSQICDLYQTLFRDLVCTQDQSPDLRSTKSHLFSHTQTQRETLSGSKANTLFYF